MKALRKWDSKIARGLLATVTGKDLEKVKLLKALAFNHGVTSMLRKVVAINRMDIPKRDTEIAALLLSPQQFAELLQFCQSICDNSWRPYTAEEEELFYANRDFITLKNSRKPLEWAWKIGFLPKEEQAHTACVVWWDIVGDTLAGNKGHFEKFDQWVVGFKNSQLISTEKLRRNLVACGYPEPVAIRRVDGDDELIETEEAEEAETEI